MADLEAELKKEREAQAAREAKLKAQQQALNDLRAPVNQSISAKPEQREEPAKANADSNFMPAASSSASGSDQPKNPGVYIPPSWHTAGQEPVLAPSRPGGQGEPELIDTESISLPGCGCGGSGPGFGTQLFAMAGMHPPSEASFEEFFRGWFEREHFPQMSEDVKRELVHRAKSKGFFS